MTGAMRAVSVMLVLSFVPACGQDPATKPPAAPSGVPVRAASPVVVAGYDLSKPRRVFALPDELREVSGIVAVDERTIACVQDEKGSIYWFDLEQGKVVRSAKFGPKGDYEGLARRGDAFFVLRSDGVLLQLAAKDDRFEIAKEIALPFGPREYEGLAMDRSKPQLLIAPKSVAKDDKDTRVLYAFDLDRGEAVAEHVLTFALADVLAAAQRLKVEVPVKLTDKGKEKLQLRLHLSEVAVHPTTGDRWLLAGADRVLLVVDGGGAVKGLHIFPTEQLPQPEGATFLPGGDLVIASEGVGGAAVLHIYAQAR
jgi:uncharacterized protein YjiK